MFSVVKMSLKGHALNSHGNYIVDHGKSWKNHAIVFLNFCGKPVNHCQLGASSIQRVKRSCTTMVSKSMLQLLSSADNICKQFGPRSELTESIS